MKIDIKETNNQRFSSTKSNYFLPELNSPLKIRRDDDYQEQQSHHNIHNSMQPKIKKLRS